jgi:hypothetical protein
MRESQLHVQKQTDTQTDREQSDLISLLLFSNKESSLKDELDSDPPVIFTAAGMQMTEVTFNLSS